MPVSTLVERTDSPRGPHRPQRVARRFGGARWVVVLAALVAQAGCYVYVPADVQPTPGAEFVFELTDQGRVALGDRLGSGVLELQGRVIGREQDQYEVSVSAVKTIGSSTPDHWGGERISVPQQYVARVRERKFSKGRTVVAAAVAAGSVAAFIVTRSLLGGGNNGERTPGGTGNGN